MPNKSLGVADPVYDALRIRSGQSIAPDLGGGSTSGGGVENKIYVWHADGSTLDLFDADTAGLTLALAAWASGDVVVIPACTIAGNFTITQTVYGLDRRRSILSGAITLNAGAIINNLTISGGAAANDGCVIYDCDISATTAPALTITGTLGNGPYIYYSTISTADTNASRYALVCTGYCYVQYCDVLSGTNAASIDNEFATFTHCIFHTATGASTTAVTLVNGRLWECQIENVAGDGLTFAGGSAYCANTNMYVRNLAKYALLITAAGLVLSDCNFNTNSGLASATLLDGDRAKWNHTHGALSNWFNVMDYGATGDGATDDTTAISDTITAIPAAGGVLYFPAGTYKVTSGLTLAKPITVRGDGGVATLTTSTAPITQINFTQATGSLFTVSEHGCSFYDLILYNTAGSTPSAGAGITVSAGGVAMHYENMEVWNFYIDIDIQSGQQLWTMDGVLLYGPVKYALKIRNAATPDGGDWSISNSTFASGAYAADAAIRLESSGGGKITNIKINQGTLRFVNGIDLAVTAGVTTGLLQISNTSIENVSGDGIHLRNTATSQWNQIIINGVQFGLYTNTSGHAISIVGVSASHFNDIVIDSCTFYATGSPGSAIDLQYVDTAFIGEYINDGFSSLLTTSNTTDIKQVGTGSGTVTSIAAGTGITATPDPIIATGTIALNAALNDLNDVDTSGTGTGDVIYNNGGTWQDYPLGIGSLITASGTKIRFGNVGGGNYLEIDAISGTLRLAGDATTYDDFRVEASVVKPGATAPNWKSFGPSGNLQALMFEASHHDEAYFELQMPHTWKLGTNIYPHIHWTPVNATAGNVVWELEYSWANVGDAFGAPGNMATDATAAGGTAWVHKLTDFKEGGNNYISGTGKTLSSMLVCRLHRNSNSGSDTLNQDVALLEVDFHYQIDSLGSDEPLVKDASASLLLETGDILLLETGDRLLTE